MITHIVVNFVVIDDNKALLVREKGSFWRLPGGHIDEGESPEGAVRREAREELACDIDFIDYPQLFNHGENAFAGHNVVSTFSHIVKSDSSLDEKHVNFGLVYVVKALGEVQNAEGQQIKWVDKNDLVGMNLHEAVSKLLMKAFEWVEGIKHI